MQLYAMNNKFSDPSLCSITASPEAVTRIYGERLAALTRSNTSCDQLKLRNIKSSGTEMHFFRQGELMSSNFTHSASKRACRTLRMFRFIWISNYFYTESWKQWKYKSSYHAWECVRAKHFYLTNSRGVKKFVMWFFIFHSFGSCIYKCDRSFLFGKTDKYYFITSMHIYRRCSWQMFQSTMIRFRFGAMFRSIIKAASVFLCWAAEPNDIKDFRIFRQIWDHCALWKQNVFPKYLVRKFSTLFYLLAIRSS